MTFAATQAFTTPMRVFGNICIKIEAHNPGGSHKSRAARHMVERAIRDHGLKAGDERRLLEKTGGNLGVGLAYEARRRGIGVDLVVGLSFSPVKRALCEIYGARLVGLDHLEAGMLPRQVIERLLEDNPGRYIFTDQFHNPANLEAHVTETGPELVRQLAAAGKLSGRRIILVKGAGTGASFTGLARALTRAAPDVECRLVLPSGCDLDSGVFTDHALEGTAAGVVPTFLDRSLVAGTIAVTDGDAVRGQQMLAQGIGFFPGMSSGANYFAAARIAREAPDAIVVTMAYDVGEGYLSRSIPAAA